jgi:hypothetical protein
MLHRFQLLPLTEGGPGGDLWGKGKLVKLDELDSVLPEGTKRLTAEEREGQLADRLELFNGRYAV